MPYKTNIIGWMPESDLQAIEEISKKIPENGIVVEIGSLFGKSSVCWAMSCPPSAKIYCIDKFISPYIPDHGLADDLCEQQKIPKHGVIYDIYSLFQENTKDFPNIISSKALVPYQMGYEGGEIDVFFLDASHCNPNDWDILRNFVPMIKAGGILCGHDYGEAFPDVMTNIERLEKIIGNKVVVTGGSVWSFAITGKIPKFE
jgi:hypothetical protein